MRIYELKQKEVINIKDGNRIGYISDVEIDVEEGVISTIIIPSGSKMFGVFGAEQEYHIPWEHVTQIGDDLVIIECDCGKMLKDVE